MKKRDEKFSPLAIFIGMAGPLDKLTKLSFFLSGAALTLSLVSFIIEITKRYFFNAPTTWSADMNRWFLALTIMLALPELTRTKGNIAITILVEKFSSYKKNIVYRAIALVSFMFCMIAVWICGGESFRQYSNDIVTIWVNPVPKWWVSAVIPYGFMICGLQFLREGIVPRPPDEA